MSEILSYKHGLEELTGQLSQILPAEVLNTFNEEAKHLAEKYNSPLKLKKGDKAPLFSLPNTLNKTIDLAELLKSGPVVIALYRGTWCPYCNLSLNRYQKALSQIKEAGAKLVAISPQTPSQSLTIKEKNELQYEVLTDADNQITRQYTSVFKISEDSISTMKSLGIDFHTFYEKKSGEIPVPAVFIIDQNGTIVFAKSEGGDYRKRVEPQEIIDALKNL